LAGLEHHISINTVAQYIAELATARDPRDRNPRN
jgi:hypothetical protein